MTISMYKVVVPPSVQSLEALSAVLKKGEASASARHIEPQTLLQARLYPDMFSLARQVQAATDHARSCAARLAGAEVPSYPNTEATFGELYTRIAKTVDYLRSLNASQIDGSEDRVIAYSSGGRQVRFKGLDYVVGYIFPNFYFHVTTAYDILRHNGVEIGKRDFLGAIPFA